MIITIDTKTDDLADAASTIELLRIQREPERMRVTLAGRILVEFEPDGPPIKVEDLIAKWNEPEADIRAAWSQLEALGYITDDPAQAAQPAP